MMSQENFDILAQKLLVHFLQNITKRILSNHYDYYDHHHHHHHHQQHGQKFRQNPSIEPMSSRSMRSILSNQSNRSRLKANEEGSDENDGKNQDHHQNYRSLRKRFEFNNEVTHDRDRDNTENKSVVLMTDLLQHPFRSIGNSNTKTFQEMHKQSQNHTNISDLQPLLRNDNDNVFATNKFVDVDTVFDQLNNLNLHNSDPYQNHNVTYNFDFDNGNDYNNNDDSDDINSTVEKLYLTHFLLAITLALIILSTVIGNLLVIAAILSERHLRSMGNYLVFSLAFADLMVAMLVMPLSAIYVVTGEWTLGASFCDLWTVADVLCCTASILHLLAIALVSDWRQFCFTKESKNFFFLLKRFKTNRKESKIKYYFEINHQNQK
ncbi:5-hydroxytryptamine receptor, partial [Sarcoptes scabiei]